jgi:hypothetical protein
MTAVLHAWPAARDDEPDDEPNPIDDDLNPVDDDPNLLDDDPIRDALVDLVDELLDSSSRRPASRGCFGMLALACISPSISKLPEVGSQYPNVAPPSPAPTAVSNESRNCKSRTMSLERGIAESQPATGHWRLRAT